MVKWSDNAKADLRRIFDFIASDSQFYAKNVIQDITRKTRILKTFPEAGRIVPERNEESIRELLVHSYRIIYERQESGALILAVIHQRRELPEQSA